MPGTPRAKQLQIEINTCTTPSAGPSSRFRPSTLTSATSKLLEPPFCRLLAGSFGMLPRGLPMSIDVKMPELYNTDLSKYSGIKDEPLSLFADMKSTAAADIAAESTRCDGLHARATYMLRREDSLIRTMYDP